MSNTTYCDSTVPNMARVSNATGMNAAIHSNSFQPAHAFVKDRTVTFNITLPDTHMPVGPFLPRLLGTGDNLLFWVPPQAGEGTIFAKISKDLARLETEQKHSDSRRMVPGRLSYSSAEEAKAARRGRRHDLKPIPNPSFPTTPDQEQLYVAQLFNAFANIESTGDGEKTLNIFKSKVHQQPERVEQACWDVLEAVKLYHIRKGTQFRSKAQAQVPFLGDFSGHIESLCDDLLAGSKTACNTLCGVWSGMDSMIDDPAKRKKATDDNRNVNLGRGYQPKPKVDALKKAQKSKQVAPVSAVVPTQADSSIHTTPAPTQQDLKAPAAVATTDRTIAPVTTSAAQVSMQSSSKKKRARPAEEIEEARPTKKSRNIEVSTSYLDPTPVPAPSMPPEVERDALAADMAAHPYAYPNASMAGFTIGGQNSTNHLGMHRLNTQGPEQQPYPFTFQSATGWPKQGDSEADEDHELPLLDEAGHDDSGYFEESPSPPMTADSLQYLTDEEWAKIFPKGFKSFDDFCAERA